MLLLRKVPLKNRENFLQLVFAPLANNWKRSVFNARSHQIFSVDTDYRLVTPDMRRKKTGNVSKEPGFNNNRSYSQSLLTKNKPKQKEGVCFQEH